MIKNKNLMIGVGPICERFGITEDQFYMFIGMGLPVRKINGRWYGHERNIDEFLQKVTLGGQPVRILTADIKKRLDEKS